MPKVLTTNQNTDYVLNSNFRSVTDLGCQPLTLNYQLNYKSQHSSFNRAVETSVEELNLMGSDLYDDTTYKEGEDNSQELS